MKSNYTIKKVREHYEIYKNGKFMENADTLAEAEKTIEEDMERGK